MKIFIIIFSLIFAHGGCQGTEAKKQEVSNPMKEEQTNLKVATLAGGCFWCVESDLEKVPGVAKVISGYTGGQKESPAYEEVTTGKTGHYEAVTGVLRSLKSELRADSRCLLEACGPDGCGWTVRGSGPPVSHGDFLP